MGRGGVLFSGLGAVPLYFQPPGNPSGLAGRYILFGAWSEKKTGRRKLIASIGLLISRQGPACGGCPAGLPGRCMSLTLMHTHGDGVITRVC